MKALASSLFSFFFVVLSITASAQTKTEKISVNGECGMCKSTIEKAATAAGASFALWNAEAKVLTVTYDSKTTNTAAIEKAVAAKGYDTEHVKASDESYNKLHGCCKYERSAAKTACCNHESCTKSGCTHEGKCAKEGDSAKACCKDAGCDKKACCSKA